MNKNLIILILILIAIAFLSFYYFSGGFQNGAEIVPPEATGEVGAIEDALFQEITDMNNLFLEEDANANLIFSDDLEIDDFGQSINENEL